MPPKSKISSEVINVQKQLQDLEDARLDTPLNQNNKDIYEEVQMPIPPSQPGGIYSSTDESPGSDEDF
jgi:hypothetical protein